MGSTETIDRFSGGLLGLALGDALGAPCEGGPLERFLWRLIGRTSQGEMRWTDDTQMALDLAESLIANKRVDPDDLANRFAKSYRWSRGYGPGAARVLKRISRGASWRDANRSVYPEGSFGNGGAMRAPVVGLFYAARPNQLVEATRASARVTHAHPLGLEGAVLIAAASAATFSLEDPHEILARAGEHSESALFGDRLEIAEQWLNSAAAPEPKEVGTKLGRGIAAAESCVTAIYLGLRFLRASFCELQDFVARCGGDVDTIGAMAGAIWGAANGCSALPEDALGRLEQRDRLLHVAVALYQASVDRSETVG